jgi:hypothetical protein
MCPSGTYGSDSRQSSENTCTTCPTGTVTYKFYYDSSPNPYTPSSMTEPGASSAGQCLADFSQVENYNWQLHATGHMASDPAATLDACISACRSQSSCAFISFKYSATAPNMCKLRQATYTTAQ